ncbi:MAG: hypothetical protein IT371_02070 [Deltaproteobacteria bacterium]|nr:hypothetical protein [Deltaproteobacteria bacterium]
MKIGGPKGPGPIEPPPLAKTEGPQGQAKVQFSETLKPSETRPAAAPTNDALTEIVARLRSGEVNAAQAVELLIGQVVEKRGGALTPAANEKLRAALQSLVAEDPLLSASLRRMDEG